jgi:hypothetical protein
MMGMSVVLIGSPISGFRVVGPFKTYEDAEEYAGNVEDEEAWVTLLEAPEPPTPITEDDTKCAHGHLSANDCPTCGNLI